MVEEPIFHFHDCGRNGNLNTLGLFNMVMVDRSNTNYPYNWTETLTRNELSQFGRNLFARNIHVNMSINIRSNVFAFIQLNVG